VLNIQEGDLRQEENNSFIGKTFDSGKHAIHVREVNGSWCTF
jgi:hypothetical protein